MRIATFPDWLQVRLSATENWGFEMLQETFASEDLVHRYFGGVDGQNLDEIFQTLTEDCVFTVETHQVRLQGRDEIAGMFHRLWRNHKSVRHDQFNFVTDTGRNRIAVQFRVTNTLHDGSLVHKSNCNFFEVKDGLFSSVNVYMAGENTLDAPDSART